MCSLSFQTLGGETNTLVHHDSSLRFIGMQVDKKQFVCSLLGKSAGQQQLIKFLGSVELTRSWNNIKTETTINLLAETNQVKAFDISQCQEPCS